MKELAQKIVNSTHECEELGRASRQAYEDETEARKNLDLLRSDLRNIMIKEQINRLTYIVEDEYVFLCMITSGDIERDQKFEIFIEPISG